MSGARICHSGVYARGRIISVKFSKPALTQSYIAIVSAGTADGAVVEEAYETARFLGNDARKFSDAGVAGLHRLIANLEQIRGAKVVIAVAGMEGALASVLAGLVSVPVIAVPTSVGYGASFWRASGATSDAKQLRKRR